MKVAVVTAPGSVELRQVPTPGLLPDEVLVSVGACGLCTMERRLYLGEKPIYPVAPGHEVSGTVTAVGEDVSTVLGAPRVGDRVVVDLLTRCGVCRPCRRGRTAVCQHEQGSVAPDGVISMGAGLAEYVKVPASQAWPVGDTSLDLAAQGEPLACVLHSVRLSGFRSGDRVAIIGAGYMGRLHMSVARLFGAVEIGIIDISQERLREADEAGASWTSTPENLNEVERPIVDVVFVTAGTEGAVELALSLCDYAGTVVLYGAFPKDLMSPVSPSDMHSREISIIGAYSQEPEDWRTAAGLLASGSLDADLETLITARYQLDDVDAALTLATSSPVYRVLVGG